MRFTFIFRSIIFLVFIAVGNTNLLAQKSPVLITYSCENKPISDVLKAIKNSYDVRFAYDAAALEKEKVTINVSNEELDNVIFLLLENKNLGYRKVGATYVIIPLVAADPIVDSTRTITIEGTVIDRESSEPLPFTNIRLLNPAKYYQCDAQGNFSILDLPSDTCTLIFYYVGYEVAFHSVKKLKRERKPTVLLGVKKDFLPTAEVIAKGKSSVESGSIAGIQSLNPQVIGSINGPGEADVLRSAQLLPGINATNESSNGLIIRGSAGDQSLLSFDGFTIYHMDHLFGVISAINPLAVKNIRISKSAAEGRVDARVGGLVQITGKEGNRYQSGARIDLGPLAAGLYLETPLGTKNNSSLMIAARRSINDFWNSPSYNELFNTVYNSSVLIENQNDASQSADYSFSDAITKLTFRPTEKDIFFISGYYSQDRLGILYNSQTTSGNYSYFYSDESEWGNRGLGMGWTRNWSTKWKHDLKVGRSSYVASLNAIDTLFDNLFQDSQRFFREGNSRLNDFKTDYQLKYLSNDATYYGGIHYNGISINSGSSDDIVRDTISTSANISTLYFERVDEWEELRWSVGGRINHYSKTNKVYPEWRANASWGNPDSILFKVSVGRVYQFVHRLSQQSLFLNQPDAWMLSGDDQIPVLYSDQFVVGVLVPLNQWQFDVEGYLKKNTGTAIDLSQILWIENDARRNIQSGTGYSLGVDILLRREWKRHEMWVSYSLAHSRMDIPGLDQPGAIAPAFDQLHEAKMNYEFKWKKWNFWSTWIFGSGRPFTQYYGITQLTLQNGSNIIYPVYGDINGARIKPYHRLDIGATYTMQREKVSFEWKASISNVYNRKNIRDKQYVLVINDQGGTEVSLREIQMNGFIPSLQLSIIF